MSAPYIPAERQGLIARLVQQQGVVNVAELSAQMGVSEITIRRDLALLEHRGVLERTHGGAVHASRLRAEPSYNQKDQEHRPQKEAIGRTAALLVEDDDTLLINSGSTTLQVFPHLRRRNLRVITSNPGAFAAAAEGGFELIVVGGVYRPQSNSLVGSLAARSLEQVCGSRAIIGVDGISVRYGLTTPSLQEAEVARLMIERTRGPVIVVADHTKLGVVSNFVSVPIGQIDVLVTDGGLEESAREELERLGIRIVLAEGART